MSVQTKTIPRIFGGTLIIQVDVEQPSTLPNATAYVRSGKATAYARSGKAVVKVRKQ